MRLPKLFKCSLFAFAALLLHYGNLFSQDQFLQKQLQQSNYLRTTMQPNDADAGLTRWLKKTGAAVKNIAFGGRF